MSATTNRKNRSALVQKIGKFIRRFSVLTPHQVTVCSHYVLLTHQFSPRCQTPYTVPYLFVNSPQKGSGKTVLGIDVMGKLCRNFEAVVNMTPATLFRLTAMQATIGIDEVDQLFAGNKSDNPTVSTLNSGYRMGGYVPRADPKAEDGVRRYPTFSPKILIGIDSGTMRDTTRDRCIPINMKRATDEERATIEPFYAFKVEQELEQIHAEIALWSLENSPGMRDYEPDDISVDLGLTPRQWEVTVPMLQIARATGQEKEMLAALKAIHAETIHTEDTPELDMLSTLQAMFEEGDQVTKGAVRSADLLARLQIDPRFRAWTGKMLGTKLAPFGIRIKPVRLSASNVQRCIVQGECLDAFKRYL